MPVVWVVTLVQRAHWLEVCNEEGVCLEAEAVVPHLQREGRWRVDQMEGVCLAVSGDQSQMRGECLVDFCVCVCTHECVIQHDCVFVIAELCAYMTSNTHTVDV